MTRFEVYYCFYGSNEDVPADAPVTMELSEIHSRLVPGLQRDGDFFGVMDQRGTTLQVMYDQEKDRYWTEFLVADRKGFYGRYLTRASLVNLLGALPDSFQPEKYPGFKFQTFPLDEK